ncbi:hypothetical protein GCM10023063_07390 [Arthrobacter methylotrophus]|uniref:DUF1674 domain-containing protein n=1 Tax=Arthrobacter methylotrophus TaxID=121291 RepID=A0ABV5UU15_9MICC
MPESKDTPARQTPETGADVAESDTELDKREKTELEATTERKPAAEGILPKKAAEDDPRRWGDDPGYDHDAWLKEQRPPHWG